MVVQATPLRDRPGDRRGTRPRRQRTWECDHIPLSLIVLDGQRHRLRPMRMLSLLYAQMDTPSSPDFLVKFSEIRNCFSSSSAVGNKLE